VAGAREATAGAREPAPGAHALAAVLAAGAHEPETGARVPSGGADESRAGGHEPATGVPKSAAKKTNRGDATHRGEGKRSPKTVLAAGAHERVAGAREPAAGAHERATGARESTARAREPATEARESAAEETYRGDTTRRGEGRRSPALDTALTSGTAWTEAPRTPWSPPQWSWLATNGSSIEPGTPTSVAGWEALSLVDNLANDLISPRPINLLTPDHPVTRLLDHSITPSPDHQAPEIRDPPPGARDQIWTDAIEGKGTVPLDPDDVAGAAPMEPDDVAAMVAAILYEQALRHGVDLS
jgi:hypothetical protein